MSAGSFIEGTEPGPDNAAGAVPTTPSGPASSAGLGHRWIVPRPHVGDWRGQRGIKGVLARLLTPRALFSTIFGLGLLAALLALGNPARAWQLTLQIGWRPVVAVALFTLPYLAARFLEWRNLLAEEGVVLSWRPILAAFAVGEFSKSLPGGIYLEDYLLRRCCGVRISVSLIATTAVSALEVLVAVPVVLGLGVPGWGWLRPTVSAVLAAYLVGVSLLWWLANPGGAEARLHLPRPFDSVVTEARALLATARPLLALRTIRDNLLPVVISLGVVALDLWLLGRAIGIHHLSFPDAAVAYGFSTLILILTPVPTDIGTTEASGAGVLLAFGATLPQAVATLLLLRVLLTGSTLLLTGPLLPVMARDLAPPIPLPTAGEGR